MKRDCVFCKIVKGEIPSYKIHENDKFLAVLDIAQFTRGHTIVIPKGHYENIWNVPNVGEYWEFVQKVGNHFLSKGFKFADTMTFGRMVLHSHVHIVPHNGDDVDWKRALNVIGRYQQDGSRRIDNNIGEKIAEEFCF